MKAMILAAGRGVRMRPLTDTLPKPLVRIHSKPLIQYHIEALAKIGVTDIIINISHMGGRIRGYLENGSRFGVKITYSFEPQALEMAGGIIQALPLLGEDPFIVISADILTSFDFSTLPTQPKGLAHIVLTSNTSEHPEGDFGLSNGYLTLTGGERLTFAGIGVYKPELFQNLEPGVMTIGPVLREAIPKQLVTGEHYQGRWHNVSTLTQVKELNKTAVIV